MHRAQCANLNKTDFWQNREATMRGPTLVIAQHHSNIWSSHQEPASHCIPSASFHNAGLATLQRLCHENKWGYEWHLGYVNHGNQYFHLGIEDCWSHGNISWWKQGLVFLKWKRSVKKGHDRMLHLQMTKTLPFQHLTSMAICFVCAWGSCRGCCSTWRISWTSFQERESTGMKMTNSRADKMRQEYSHIIKSSPFSWENPLQTVF